MYTMYFIRTSWINSQPVNIWGFFPNLALVEHGTKWIHNMWGPAVCQKFPSFFLTFDLKYVQFQTVVSPSSIFVQHQGLFEAWNPLITFFGGLTAEISGCARSCVRDLKPGVLTDNRGVHRLDGNVLGIQLKTLNETLENKENLYRNWNI